MSQKAQPVGDVEAGSWTPTPIYVEINEEVPDDDTFVSSEGTPEGDSFVVKFPVIGRPMTGTHTLTVRLRKDGSGSRKVLIALLQGTTVIKESEIVPSNLFEDHPLVLEASDVDKITDYASLRLRVTAYNEESSSSSSSSSSSESSESSSSGSSESSSSSSSSTESSSSSSSESSSASAVAPPTCSGTTIGAEVWVTISLQGSFPMAWDNVGHWRTGLVTLACGGKISLMLSLSGTTFSLGNAFEPGVTCAVTLELPGDSQCTYPYYTTNGSLNCEACPGTSIFTVTD